MAFKDQVAQGLVWTARRSLLGRGKLRGQLLSLLKGPMGLAYLDTRIDGRPLRLHLDNNSEAKFLVSPGVFNAREFAFIRDRMPRDGGVFVDVGANAGIFAFTAAAHAHTRCRVLCIEPNPMMVERMRRNVLREGAFALQTVRIAIEACAVSDGDGEGWLDLGHGLGMARLAGGGASEGGVKVPLRRLDAVLRAHGLDHVDVLKIDVEGHEDKALRPLLAEENRALWPGAIIIEHCSRELWGTDVIASLMASGYRDMGRTRNNLMLVLDA
ncbi:MAG: FkbM family methyltransferase [Alphaproteobacteria bacterium]